MNIRDLHYLLAVHDLQHFGKAAEAVFVSQPALSMQLQKLEKELGVQLFERNNKRVLTTEVAQQMIPLARNIIKDVKSIQDIARNSLDPLAGVLKLGAFPTLAPYLLPKIVSKIKKQLPNIMLLLVEEKTDVLLKQLLSGDIDAALLALPIEKNVILTQKHLFDDPFYLAVSKAHPLAKRKKVTLKDVREEKILLLEEEHCLRDQVLSFCSGMNTHEDLSFRATSLETLRHMIALNVGITLIPEIALDRQAEVTYIPFVQPSPIRQIGIVWQKNSSKLLPIMKIANIIEVGVSSRG